MIDGVAMEINLPNWIRGMLRQRMVVARHAITTYKILKSWFNDVIYFIIDMVRVPILNLPENGTENRFHVPVHKTRGYFFGNSEYTGCLSTETRLLELSIGLVL